MSKTVIVSVYDQQMGAFGRPFFVPSVGAAIRSFTDEVNRVAEDNIMNAHPEDFALYKIGTFDDFNGDLESEEVTPTLLIKADSVVLKN